MSHDRAVAFKLSVDEASWACAQGDFGVALKSYGDAIKLDPENHTLYANRSAVLCKLAHFEAALLDALKCHELKPHWTKALYRKGAALKGLKRYEEAIQNFCMALAKDASNKQFLQALLDCLYEYPPFNGTFACALEQLKILGLDQDLFILISMTGQEMLTLGHVTNAVRILESSLLIGSDDDRIVQSVYSALFSAHFLLENWQAAKQYVEHELSIAISLTDVDSEVKARNNLGMVLIKLGNSNGGLSQFEKLLTLHAQVNDGVGLIQAHYDIGLVFMQIFHYEKAEKSFEVGLQLLEKNSEMDFTFDNVEIKKCQFLQKLGQLYMASGRLENARKAYTENMAIISVHAANSDLHVEALMLIGWVCQKKSETEQARRFYLDALKLLNLSSKNASLEAQLCGHLFNVNMQIFRLNIARRWADKHLQLALSSRDLKSEALACANLGKIELCMGNSVNAQRLFERQKQLAENLIDKRLVAQSHQNLARLCRTNGDPQGQVAHLTRRLEMVQNLQDFGLQSKCHASLAFAYLSIISEHSPPKNDSTPDALLGPSQFLALAEAHAQQCTETSASAGYPSCQLSLELTARFFARMGSVEQAVSRWDDTLMAAQERGDATAERRACRALGRLKRKLGQHNEAVRYFDQELALSKESRDPPSIARAYGDLSASHLAAGRLDDAVECAKYFCALAHLQRSPSTKLAAARLMGDILTARGKHRLAFKLYARYLKDARALVRDEGFLTRQFSRQLADDDDDDDVTIDSSDDDDCVIDSKEGFVRHETLAYGRLGRAFDSLGKRYRARQCFEEQLARSQNYTKLRNDALHQLAAHFKAHGDIERCVQMYQLQLDDCAGVNNFELQSEILKNLANLHKIAPELKKKSAAYLQQRIEIVERAKMLYAQRHAVLNQLYTNSFLDLIELYTDTQQFAECLEVYTKFFENCEDEQTSVMFDNCSVNKRLADVWCKVGNFDRTLCYLHVEIEQNANDLATSSQLLLNSSICLLNMKKYDECKVMTEKCLALCQKLNIYTTECHCLLILAKIELYKENSLKNCLDLALTALNLARQKKLLQALCNIYVFLYFVHEKNDVNVASAYLQQAAKISSKNIEPRLAINCSTLLAEKLFDSETFLIFIDQSLNLCQKIDNFEVQIELIVIRAVNRWFHNEFETAFNDLCHCLQMLEEQDCYLGDPIECFLCDPSKKLNIPVTVNVLLTYLSLRLERKNNLLQYAKNAHYFMDLDTLKICGISKKRLIGKYAKITSGHTQEFFHSDQSTLICCIMQNNLFTWIFGNDSYPCHFEVIPITQNSPVISHAPFLTFNAMFNTRSMAQTVDRLCDDALNFCSVDRSMALVSSDFDQYFSNLLENRTKIGKLVLIGFNRPLNVDRFEIAYDTFARKCHFLLDKHLPDDKQLSINGELLTTDENLSFKCKSNQLTYSAERAVSQPCSENDIRCESGDNRIANVGKQLNSNSCAVFLTQENKAKSSDYRIKCVVTREISKRDILCLFSEAQLVFVNLPVHKDSANSPENCGWGFCLNSENSSDNALIFDDDFLNYDLCCKIVFIPLIDFSDHSAFILARKLILAGCQCVVFLPISSEKIEPHWEFFECVAKFAFDNGLVKIREFLKSNLNVIALKFSDLLIFGELCKFEPNHVDVIRKINAYHLLLRTPDECREAMLVVLHLVEKSLQRIDASITTPLYTAEHSVKTKAGPEVQGVFELLDSLGFTRHRLNDVSLEMVRYFPSSDHFLILNQASSILQAFLRLPPSMYTAFSKLIHTRPDVHSWIFAVLNRMRDDFLLPDFKSVYQINITNEEYDVTGISDLFAALGLDAIMKDSGSVLLKSIRVELTAKKLQDTLTCLLALLVHENNWEQPKKAPKKPPRVQKFLDSTSELNFDHLCLTDDQSPVKSAKSGRRGTKMSAKFQKFGSLKIFKSKKFTEKSNNAYDVSGGYLSDGDQWSKRRRADWSNLSCHESSAKNDARSEADDWLVGVVDSMADESTTTRELSSDDFLTPPPFHYTGKGEVPPTSNGRDTRPVVHYKVGENSTSLTSNPADDATPSSPTTVEGSRAKTEGMLQYARRRPGTIVKKQSKSVTSDDEVFLPVQLALRNFEHSTASKKPPRHEYAQLEIPRVVPYLVVPCNTVTEPSSSKPNEIYTYEKIDPSNTKITHEFLQRNVPQSYCGKNPFHAEKSWIGQGLVEKLNFLHCPASLNCPDHCNDILHDLV